MRALLGPLLNKTFVFVTHNLFIIQTYLIFAIVEANKLK